MGRRRNKNINSTINYPLESLVHKSVAKDNKKTLSRIRITSNYTGDFMYIVTVKHNKTRDNYLLGILLNIMINQPS